MDFGDILRRSAAFHGGSVAVWCDGREQTYAEMFDRACRLSNALRSLGVEKGDRVALLGANGFETVEQVAGIAWPAPPRSRRRPRAPRSSWSTRRGGR